MKKTKRKLMALLTVLVMLLNIGGAAYADTNIFTPDSAIESEAVEAAEKDPAPPSPVEAPGKQSPEPAGQALEPVVELEKEVDAPVVLNTEVNGISITVSADTGVLPQDTRLVAGSISDDDSQNYAQRIREDTGTSLDRFIAFDITLVDKEGWEIQPNGQVEVSFTGVEFIKEAQDIMVYHLEPKEEDKEDVNSRRMAMNFNKISEEITVNEILAQSSEDEVVFTTDHFSIYGVGTVATASYEFYVGLSLEDTQILLNGQKLEEPTAPAKQEGKKFIGWYLEGATEPIDFTSHVIVGIGPSQTYRVEARFDNILYVYFVYDDDIVATKEVEPGGITNSSNIPLVVTEPGKAFVYWSTEVDGAEFNLATPIIADTTLYAVLADRWKVTFDAQGGKAVLPQYIVNGESIATPEPTTRSGYTFKHWSLAVNGEAYTTSLVEADMKLYAVWQANNNTPYTVVYWQENANDNKYTLKEVVQRTGTTGTNATYQNKSYTGFNLNSSKTNNINVTIAGDGSTVKHVYYDRNTWTLTFYKNYKKFLGPWKMTKLVEYSGIKQGADTAYWWNQAASNNPTYIWYTASGGNTAYSLAPDMPNKELTVYGRSSGDTKYTIFYLENGTNAQVHAPYYFSGNSGLKLTIEDYVAFPGFTVKSTLSDGSKDSVYNNISKRNEWKLFYTRNKYDITFKKNDLSGNQIISQIPYQSDISDKALAGYLVDDTIRASDGFIFKGWYDNENTIGDAFNFAGKTMPAGNLILYAKWTAPTHVVSVHRTPGEDSVIDPKTVDRGATLPGGELVKDIPDGLTESDFLGWYWFVGQAFVPYDFTMEVNSDFDLYPVWNINTYKVAYQLSESSPDLGIDANTYYMGASAAVLPLPATSIPPVGKVFVGWKAQSATRVYYPNENLVISGNMTLIAQWGNVVPGTSLTYKANGGTEPDSIIPLSNNATHIVLANMFSRAGYDFAGWNTKADGSGESFQPNEEIIVGNSDPVPNELYAQWVTAQYTINYLPGLNGTISGLTPQIVPHGGDTTQVTAIPDVGYYFTGWEDGNLNPSRNEINVTANATYTANFAKTIDLAVKANSPTKVYDGTPLVGGGYTATGALATGDYVVAIVGGTITDVGTAVSTLTQVKVMNGSTDVTANYNLSTTDGTLTVTPKPITVTAASQAFTYDGSPHSNASYTVDGLIGTDTLSATIAGSITYPSQSPVVNKITGHTFTSGKATNYSLNYINGQLTMEEANMALNVTANSDTKVYDGNPLVGAGYTSSGTLATGDEIVASVVGTITDVGTTESTLTQVKVMNGSTDVTANYNLSTTDGTLTVTPKPITVTAASQAFTYDGSPHSNASYTVAGLIGTDTLSATIAGSITYPSQSPVVNKIIGHTFTSGKATNYSLNYINGHLTMASANIPLTVTANSNTKVYDGTPLVGAGYTSTGTLAIGDEIVATVAGTITNAGTTASTVTVKVMNGLTDVTANYNLTLIDGSLTVTAKAVTVTAASQNFVYDGSLHSNSAYTVAGLVGSDTLAATVVGSITYPIQSPVVNTVVAHELTGIADNYVVTYVNGALTMAEANITLAVTADNATKVYDGTPLVGGGYTYSGTLATGDEIVATVGGAITNVGTAASTVSVKVMNGLTDVTANYNLSTTDGTLTVTPKPITVTAASQAFTYDGSSHSNASYTVDGLVGSDTLAATVVGSITYPTQSPVVNEITGHTFTSGMATNYTLNYINGQLTMAPANIPLTVTANSNTKVYDGTPLVGAGYTSTGTLAIGDEIVATVAGTITNAGTTASTVTVKVMNGLTDVTANYNLILIDGSLTVTARPVTITAASENFIYDGSLHSNAGYTVDGLVGSDSLTANIVGTITYPSQSPVENTVVVHELTGTADNYAVAYENGTLTMEEANIALTLIANDATKVYDGTPLVGIGYTYSGLLATGDEIVATVSGTITNVGTAASSLTVKVMNGSTDVTANYNLSLIDGELTITPKPVTITAASENFVYDGTAQANASYTVAGLVGSDDLTATVVGSITYPSQSPTMNRITGHAFPVGLATNYTLNYVNGQLTMEKASIDLTVTANSERKAYTGLAQTVDGYLIPDGLLEGHVLSGIQASGSGTDLGDYPVNFTGTPVIMDGLVDVTENYRIILIPGTFRIWRSELTVEKSANKASFTTLGEEIIYTYKITNTGSITLSGPFSLVDNKIETVDMTSAPEKLAPGETFTVTAVYAVTQTDMNSGLVTNLVSVTGIYEDGEDIEEIIGEDQVTVRRANPTTPTDDDEDFVEVEDDDVPLGGPTDSEELIEIEDDEIPLGLPIDQRLNMIDHFRYIVGYPNNTVKPEGFVTREEVAAVFFRLLTPGYSNSIRTRSHNFKDVKVGRWSEESIASLAKDNILAGYEDGSFRPDKHITRAELAAIASRFDNLSPFASNKFSDIADHWASESINSAAEKGWVKGYEDGSFKPNQYITRAEFVTLINNVLKRKVRKDKILPDARQFPDLKESKWYYEAMEEAINSHHYTRDEDGLYEIWTDIY